MMTYRDVLFSALLNMFIVPLTWLLLTQVWPLLGSVTVAVPDAIVVGMVVGLVVMHVYLLLWCRKKAQS